MDVRITQNSLIRNALADLSRRRLRFAELQEQAASGLRINRPSDDPSGSSAALLLKAGIHANEQFESNVVQTRIRTGAAESALAAANDTLIRGRELAMNGASDTHDATSRRLLAAEVEALHDSLVSEANTRASGAYVFAGFASDAAPFVASGPFVEGGPSPTVSFVGDSSEIEVAIDAGVMVRSGLDGRRVFQGDGDGDSLLDPGREDVFDLMASLRDALVINDADAVRATLTRFDTAITQMNVERADLGAIDTRLEIGAGRLAQREVDLQSRLSLTQDADAAEVFSGLVNEEAALQAVLASMQRLVQPTLLDFLA